ISDAGSAGKSTAGRSRLEQSPDAPCGGGRHRLESQASRFHSQRSGAESVRNRWPGTTLKFAARGLRFVQDLRQEHRGTLGKSRRYRPTAAGVKKLMAYIV